MATASCLVFAAPEAEVGKVSGKSDSLDLHRRLADEFAEIDPGQSGWQSESFSEDIAVQMKALAKMLIHPEDLTAKKVSEFAGESLHCGALRPTDLQPLSRNPAMTVLGPKPNPAEEGPLHHGAEGLLEALKSLASYLDRAEHRRAEFKVMHVELKGETALTKMLFEMRGQKADGWYQLTATWHAEWTNEAPFRLRKLEVTDYREARPGVAGHIQFVDTAPAILNEIEAYREQLAHSFDYWRARSDKSLVADLLGAQGIAVGDVNGDELDDLYVLQPGGLPNRLFLHQPDGTARDGTETSGAGVLDFCRSALLIDLDNDGDLDLALGLAWKLHLMENDGKGVFTSRGTFPSDGQVNSMASADFDNDGDLDIYLCGRDASGAIKAEQGALGVPMPYYDANNGGPNTLFRNDGAFALVDVTAEVGMNDNNRRFSLACAWEDFDNDGDQDLYVANDFGRNNLFRNDPGTKPGTRRFVDIAEEAGVVDIGPGMSAAWGDYNRDGLLDLYVANMWSNAGNRITLQKQFLPDANSAIKAQARRHARGNSVYLNNGDGTFRDHTRHSGANMARWAWSSNFIDMDNDGNRDLVVANGMITAGDAGDL